MVEVVKELKKLKNALCLVRVYLDEGGHRDIALGGIRQKWQRLEKTLGAMNWVKIEALDDKGALLSVVGNAEPEGEPESDPWPGLTAKVVDETSASDSLAQLMLGQEFVLNKFQSITESTMGAQERVIEMLSTQLEQVNEKYLNAMALIHDLSVDLVESEVAVVEAEASATPEETSPIVKTAMEAVTSKVVASVMGAKQ